jgi:hypothetical protein
MSEQQNKKVNTMCENDRKKTKFLAIYFRVLNLKNFNSK